MAKETDIYKKQLNNQSTPINGDMTPKETDSATYNDLRKESYRTMLNSEIQASIAKDRALKYTQNTLAAQGLGSQGVSESARVGIMNNYHNANQDAVSQYRKELLGINQDERKEDLANFDTNAEYLTELLDGTKKQDINGNVIGADLDEYREIMKNYGFKFNENNEIDATNAKVNEAQKLAFIDNYNKALRDYGNANNVENNNAVKVDNIKTFEQTNGNFTNFYQGIKTNAKFSVQTKNGKDLTLELGNKISNYSDRIDVGTIENESTSKAVGDIWLSTKANPSGKNLLTLVVKDSNNDVRAVEAKTGIFGATRVDDILELFNQHSDLDLKKNDRGYFVDKNGKEYSYHEWPDGSFYLKERK